MKNIASASFPYFHTPRKCEDDFDGDGIPDSEDVSLTKIEMK